MQPKVKNTLLIGFIVIGSVAVFIMAYGDRIWSTETVNEGPKTVIVTPPNIVPISQQVNARASTEWTMPRAEYEGLQELQKKEYLLIRSQYDREISENRAAVAVANFNIEVARLDVEQKKKELESSLSSTSAATNSSAANRGSSSFGSAAQMGNSLENTIAGSQIINSPEDQSVLNKFNVDGSIIITVSGVTSQATKGSVVNGVRIMVINSENRTVKIKGVKSRKLRTIMFNARSTRSYAAQRNNADNTYADGDENTASETEG